MNGFSMISILICLCGVFVTTRAMVNDESGTCLAWNDCHNLTNPLLGIVIRDTDISIRKTAERNFIFTLAGFNYQTDSNDLTFIKVMSFLKIDYATTRSWFNMNATEMAVYTIARNGTEYVRIFQTPAELKNGALKHHTVMNILARLGYIGYEGRIPVNRDQLSHLSNVRDSLLYRRFENFPASLPGDSKWGFYFLIFAQIVGVAISVALITAIAIYCLIKYKVINSRYLKMD